MSRGGGRGACACVLAASLFGLGACRPGGPQPEPAGGAPPPPVPRALPAEAFRVEWTAHTVPPLMKAGASEPVSATVKNTSSVPWPAAGTTGNQPPHAGAVRLGYRWWSGSSPTPLVEPRTRTDLVRSIAPGESATLTIEVAAPAAPGDYTLQLDLVQELVTWFEPQGADQLLVAVQVR